MHDVPRQQKIVQTVLSELDRELPAPDPQLADDVLALSCAVSERDPASDPVHRYALPLNIQDVLRSTALATHVREEEVDRIAAGIARKRAETDLRVAATREICIGETFEIRARFNGDPDCPEQSDIDAYEAALAKGAASMQRAEPPPNGGRTPRGPCGPGIAWQAGPARAGAGHDRGPGTR